MGRIYFLLAALMTSSATGMAWAQPPTTGPDQSARPDDRVFRDAKGNPLPEAVQEQLREHFRKNPEALRPASLVDDEEPGEIVVSRTRPRGSVVSDIPAERSFNAQDIRAYGTSTITELLDALAPQLASNRGRGDNPPVTLLNGRRIADFSEIARIPTEAIEQTEVFPEELALQYGYRADQKVVNIITFERFDSQFGQVSVIGATDGGWASATATADHFQISGDTRFSLNAAYTRSGNVLESERDLAQPSAPPDRGDLRTLVPRSERVEIGGLVGRPLGGTISGTLSAKFEHSETRSLLGREAGIAAGALERDIGTDTLRLGAAVNGRLDRWLWNATSNYLRADTTIVAMMAGSAASERTGALAKTYEAGLLFNGPLATLPAGQLLTSIRGGVAVQDFAAETSFGSATGSANDLSRRIGSIQLSVDLPLLTDAGPLGALSLNGNLGLQSLSDTDDLRTLGYGVVWSPVEAIGIVASLTHEQGAPTLQQLGAPLLETPGVRTFDFARGEVVDILRLSGGNSDLVNDQRDVFRFGFNARPIARTDLTISVDYVATTIDNPISSFPTALPQVEAAFPDRFERGNDGRLSLIDARPVNFANSHQERLRWGVAFTRPLGPVPAGMQPANGLHFTSVEEAQRAMPNATIITAEPGSALARQGENLRSRFFANLYHNWYLEDRGTLRDGLPTLDLLEGGALDFLGGRRRHEVEFQVGALKRGLGARMDVRWQSDSEIRGGPNGDLRFSSLGTVNLNLFADLGQRAGGPNALSWLKGMRATLGVDNLLGTRPQVRDTLGQVPIAYQPANLDPLGRTVSFNLRKVF